MDESTYKILTTAVILVIVVSLGMLFYQAIKSDPPPGQVALLAADRAFADGHYERALNNYKDSLDADPERVESMRGMARTLLQKEKLEEAIIYFNMAIEQEPEFAGTYANRGIAYDRMGEHELALRDYELALHLDPSTGDGPGWITRLLHMDAAGQPTVKDRAAYLREQLALPEEERLLSVPEEDQAQRTYRRR